MAIFCSKKLEEPQVVGTRLKKTRENKGIDLETISTKTRIAVKYLQAIESGSICDLPQTKAHCLAYVRAYATELGLNPNSVSRQFVKETDLENLAPAHPLRQMKFNRFGSLGMLARSAAGGALVLVFFGYLAWQIYGILQPPKLTVFSPSEGYVTNQLSIAIKGETQKETQLTVNGKETMANEQGKFETAVDLSNGLNTITITATKKHGKTTTVTRHVVVNTSGVATTEEKK